MDRECLLSAGSNAPKYIPFPNCTVSLEIWFLKSRFSAHSAEGSHERLVGQSVTSAVTLCSGFYWRKNHFFCKQSSAYNKCKMLYSVAWCQNVVIYGGSTYGGGRNTAWDEAEIWHQVWAFDNFPCCMWAVCSALPLTWKKNSSGRGLLIARPCRVPTSKRSMVLTDVQVATLALLFPSAVLERAQPP